jgi:fatty-acid desaturase
MTIKEILKKYYLLNFNFFENLLKPLFLFLVNCYSYLIIVLCLNKFLKQNKTYILLNKKAHVIGNKPIKIPNIVNNWK